MLDFTTLHNKSILCSALISLAALTHKTQCLWKQRTAFPTAQRRISQGAMKWQQSGKARVRGNEWKEKRSRPTRKPSPVSDTNGEPLCTELLQSRYWEAQSWLLYL